MLQRISPRLRASVVQSNYVKRILIIAALDRELSSLVRGCSHQRITSQSRTVSIWESDRIVAACAGVGGISARVATDVAYKTANGDVAYIVSTGLAGGLTPALGVAAIVQPAIVKDGVDGLAIQ